MAKERGRKLGEDLQGAEAGASLMQRAYDLLDSKPFWAGALVLYTWFGSIVAWLAGAPVWLVWPLVPVLFVAGTAGLFYWDRYRNPRLSPSSQPVSLKGLVVPGAALELYSDQQARGTRDTAEALINANSDEYLRLLAENLMAARDTPAGYVKIGQPQREQRIAEIVDQKERATQTRDAARQKMATHFLLKLVRGELIAEGFAKPTDTEPTRINPAEWRKFAGGYNDLRTTAIRLGGIEYTGIAVGEPAQD